LFFVDLLVSQIIYNWLTFYGRGGRDSITCHCILFIRHHDRLQSEKFVGLKNLMNKDTGPGLLVREKQVKAKEALDQVVCGDENNCRYEMLASNVTLNEALSKQRGEPDSLSDLCLLRAKKEAHMYALKKENCRVIKIDGAFIGNVKLESVVITPFVKVFFDQFSKESLSMNGLRLSNVNAIIDDCIKIVNSENQEMPLGFASGNFRQSLKMDFIRYLIDLKVFEIEGLDQDKYCSKAHGFFIYHEKVKSDEICFKLINVRKVCLESEAEGEKQLI